MKILDNRVVECFWVEGEEYQMKIVIRVFKK